MAATLQVVLQSDVANVGKSGELVKVRPGFARNYLIPRSLAVPATTAAVNRINHEKAVAVAKADKAKKEAQGVAEKINGLKLTMARSVGEDDRLFGSVTAKEIESAAKAAGIEIDRKKMHLAEPLKALGTFEIPVKLMTDVTATLKVEVVKK
ncbi:LSU ribosomal protein L9p [Labilithrix luteola]|uniref:Large ribosomal subunit protein bL9 n=1 Tax=Labilithrix luteola TaxID=1391654 RepID=A0A0K1Q7M1_9BACT|nr:50S ribosomal protein L9 [Labilithrix luteola]AKV01709.1 LSU ribosomal protein L9p [Labilithrix luteola]